MKSICKQAEQARILRDRTPMELGTDVLGQVVGLIGFSSFEVARAPCSFSGLIRRFPYVATGIGLKNRHSLV